MCAKVAVSTATVVTLPAMRALRRQPGGTGAPLEGAAPAGPGCRSDNPADPERHQPEDEVQHETEDAES